MGSWYKKDGKCKKGKDLVVALSGSEMERRIEATEGRVLGEAWVAIQ